MAPTEHRELVRRLERALARGTRLLAVTRGLQTALTPVDVADVLTRHIRAASGAFFTGIALVDDEARQLRYLSMSPLPKTTTAAWQIIPLDTDAPVADAVRTGQSHFLESIEQAEARFPGIGAHMTAAGTRAMAHLPLIASNGKALGTLAVSFAETRRISPHEREFLTTLAGYAAQAMERALLYEQQRSVAEVLQGAVLPTALPVLDGWQVDGRFQPAARGHGGRAATGTTPSPFPTVASACAVGDATGHGLAAARVMSSVRHALRAYAVLGRGRPRCSPGSRRCSATSSRSPWPPWSTSNSTPAPAPAGSPSPGTRRWCAATPITPPPSSTPIPTHRWAVPAPGPGTSTRSRSATASFSCSTPTD